MRLLHHRSGIDSPMHAFDAPQMLVQILDG